MVTVSLIPVALMRNSIVLEPDGGEKEKQECGSAARSAASALALPRPLPLLLPLKLNVSYFTSC